VVKGEVGKADNLTAIFLENVGASKSHNPMGLHGPLTVIAFVSSFAYEIKHYTIRGTEELMYSVTV
jgi:hypothetical protein